jgi:hypothetical protein
MSVVASYYYPYEAHLARSQLEAGGIEAWVLDEHQVQMRWHLAAALGGVKVAVSPADARAAIELLSAPPSESIVADQSCPRCAGSRVEIRRALKNSPIRAALSVAVSFLFGGLIPIRKHESMWHCTSCNHSWPGAPAT